MGSSWNLIKIIPVDLARSSQSCPEAVYPSIPWKLLPRESEGPARTCAWGWVWEWICSSLSRTRTCRGTNTNDSCSLSECWVGMAVGDPERHCRTARLSPCGSSFLVSPHMLTASLPYKWSPLLVWKGTESHTVTQAGLDMKHSSPPVSWALGLQADTTTCSPNGKLSPSLVLVAQLGLAVLIFRLHVPLCL